MIEQKFVCDFCKKVEDMPVYKSNYYKLITIHAGKAMGHDSRFTGPTIDLAFYLCRPCYEASGITAFENLMDYEIHAVEDFRAILHKVIRFFRRKE